MITIPVALARSCLGVFRRVPVHRGREPPMLGVVAGRGGLRLRLQGTDAAVEMHHPEPCPEAAFCVRADSLDAEAGSPVVLIVHDGSVALAADVIARTSGGLGETVTVYDEGARKMLSGLVTAPSRVELTLPEVSNQ